jgi:hypothetical protein
MWLVITSLSMKEEELSLMGKRKRFVPKDIESAKGVGDTSANIYRSMLLHPACKDLTASQFRLYVYCKSDYTERTGMTLMDSLHMYGMIRRILRSTRRSGKRMDYMVCIPIPGSSTKIWQLS